MLVLVHFEGEEQINLVCSFSFFFSFFFTELRFSIDKKKEKENKTEKKRKKKKGKLTIQLKRENEGKNFFIVQRKINNTSLITLNQKNNFHLSIHFIC